MLPLLFCFILVVTFKEAHAISLSGPIQLVLASTNNGTGKNETDASDTFYDLLHDFAQSHQHHFNRGNLRVYETNINGLPMTKFGLNFVNCEDLLKFLHGIEPGKYNLKYASLRCGERLSMSMCLIPPCDPNKYKRA
ncbi:hypothetical protein OESDEN_22694 [Oesophagostomum dentatum]|uniref:Transthyretin-like family protein n=1 Tax=Oesophagostomum dentatum TaxID=61180 RepID=A0A0B1S1D7_OESDE|nr:hypothetical protein OESDEN_22694 [Oesophagostomum dentatum]